MLYVRAGSFIERRIFRCAYRCVGIVATPLATVDAKEAGLLSPDSDTTFQGFSTAARLDTFPWSLILPALSSLSVCERSFWGGLTLIGLSIAEG